MSNLEELLKDFLEKLKEILSGISEEVAVQEKTTLNKEIFFDEVRPLFGKLSTSQVKGMEAKLTAFREASFPLSWAAYALATSYHETAKRMMPVREGLSVSDAWRKKNLRYYPYYGRGDVQLTWRENYAKADKELGLHGALLSNLDLALDPDISAKVLVRGMKDGWFSGDKKGRHTLARHLKNAEASKAEFVPARRIVNILDKADLIAGIAVKFQAALKKAGYGEVG